MLARSIINRLAPRCRGAFAPVSRGMSLDFQPIDLTVDPLDETGAQAASTPSAPHHHQYSHP